MIKVFSKTLVVVALAFCMIIFSSCEKTEDVVLDFKYEYYPTQIGHYVIYDVDSIIFDDFTETSDTFHYQKKYVIDSTFTDGMGRQAHKLLRYHRADSTQAWTLSDVWSVVVNATSLEVVEENQRFVKLLFPPREEQTWDGNKYINITSANWYLEDWEYTAASVDVSEIVNQMQFDSAVTVIQQDYETLIEKVYAEERYAKNVGMVYKSFLALEKRGNISLPWTQPESGFILTMTINSYGN